MAVMTDDDPLLRARIRLRRLTARWAHLEPAGRKVLVLCEAAGLSEADAARVLGLAEDEVRRMLARLA